MSAPSIDAELRSRIARLGEGEDGPAFHFSHCGLASGKSDCFKPRLSDNLRRPDSGQIVEHWTPDRWVPFWFDSNAAFGTAHNRNEWDDIRVAWMRGNEGIPLGRIYDARCTVSDGPGRAMSFGFYSEHVGPQTLREFFKKNGMML